MTRSLAVARRLSFGLVLATFALVILGAIVRATGSGLACPDWPLCHGRLLPPLQTQVLLEWSHRFVALLVSTGFLVLAVLVGASVSLRRAVGGRLALAAGLLVVQIVLGALTVWKLLAFGVVTLHLGTALLFLAALVSIAERLRDDGAQAPGAAGAGRGLAFLFLLAAATTYGQTLLGGLVSTNHAGLACPDFPGCHGDFLPKMSGLVGFQMWHRFGAYGLAVLLGVLAFAARRAADPRLSAAASLAPAIVVLQIVLGVMNVLLAVPVWLTAAHLATATTLYVLLVLATLRAYRSAA